MAHHTNYWCCTPFADKLRGTAKPGAATAEAWDQWYIEASAAHPVRYWLAEEGLGKVQDFITWPRRKVSDVRHYITNRFVSKTHALTSNLERGKYYEYEHRLLHCVFQSLVDYVEVEEAWCQVSWGDATKKYKSTRRFWWNEWRCAEAGIDRLKWASSLVYDKDWMVDETSPNFGKPTPQAIHAQEILDLYTWWTVVRPVRPDPYEASGWTAFNAESADAISEASTKAARRLLRANRTAAHKKESSRLFGIAGKIDAKYEKEDEQMLIRLVKIRKGMWT